MSRQSAREGGQVVSPAHRPPRTHSCYRLSRSQVHSAAERITSMRTPNDSTRNRGFDSILSNKACVCVKSDMCNLQRLALPPCLQLLTLKLYFVYVLFTYLCSVFPQSFTFLSAFNHQLSASNSKPNDHNLFVSHFIKVLPSRNLPTF
jgi:hypothetical protein